MPVHSSPAEGYFRLNDRKQQRFWGQQMAIENEEMGFPRVEFSRAGFLRRLMRRRIRHRDHFVLIGRMFGLPPFPNALNEDETTPIAIAIRVPLPPESRRSRRRNTRPRSPSGERDERPRRIRRTTRPALAEPRLFSY